ncbi:hypothetical protein [Halalkalicoccus sp. NIPERK01]|uniref:hypothetical protein n=1 Tax=Halalkalicoccus sp. NIPERK01 TaxID=3053469 RepID=UPI00256F4839|nr:hypothetical protein [Halalkalicoccus sp. NIPERK01]MDL5362446.1 hypothetical protein [Halalkalicoccus sp. NIPERK01]
MRRRQICKVSLAGVAIPLGGCLGRLDPRPSNEIETPKPVAEADFEFSDGRYEDHRNNPTVRIDAENGRAVVTGTLLVGSGSCNEATLDGITYDGESDTVTVVVTWASDEGGVCTDDISADEYEVRLEFESLPSAITAIERDYRDEEYTTTEEIDTN